MTEYIDFKCKKKEKEFKCKKKQKQSKNGQ